MKTRRIETIEEAESFDSQTSAKPRKIETIEVAGKLGALEATVVEARTQLAHLGMALMAEQPDAVRGCASEQVAGLRQSSVSSGNSRDCSADQSGEGGLSRTTVDTYALEGSLRKQLSANLQTVRERIQAVSNECMQELIRAQLMLGGASGTTAGSATIAPCAPTENLGLNSGDRPSSAPSSPRTSEMSPATVRSLLLRSTSVQVVVPEEPGESALPSGRVPVKFPP